MQLIPLAAMSPAPGTSSLTGYQSNAPHTFDTTGQIAPPGMKPRVTATLWEDEGSLCFQVEAKGVCVARREGMLEVPVRDSISPPFDSTLFRLCRL